MGALLQNVMGLRPNGVPLSVWAGSRVAGIVIGTLIIWALFAMSPHEPFDEPPVIEGVVFAPIDLAAPSPATEPRLQSSPATQAAQPASARATKPPVTAPRSALAPITPQQSPSPAVRDRPTPNIGQAQTTPSNIAPGLAGPASPTGSPRPGPRDATAPNSQGNPSSNGAPTGASGNGAGQRLGSSTIAILRARECLRLDVRDRPADCPPNQELQRLLAQERDPKYRPENADAFSRNELRWRGVDPPCLDDGENAKIKGTKLCVRFGNVPSRVRSVREICEARGLGGCEDAPSQAAVNSAVEQVRRQEAAKAAQP